MESHLNELTLIWMGKIKKKVIDLPSDFVAQGLSGNDCDFLTYPLVCVKIKGQPRVILLNNNFRRFLDGLSPDTTLGDEEVLL